MRLPKFSFLVCLLLSICGTAVGAPQRDNAAAESDTNPTVKVNGLNSAGIELISPESPDFDSAVVDLLPTQTAQVVLDLKPFVLIVSNQSAGDIVAYAVVWKVTYKDRPTVTTTVYFKYPDAIAGIADSGAIALNKQDDLPVLSHQRRVIGKDFVVGPSWEEEYYLNQFRLWPKSQQQEVAAIEQIEVDLDAAIFSDGLLVGPNSTGLDQDFMTSFAAKQNFFRQIASDLDSGRDIDGAFAPLKVLTANPLSQPRDRAAYYERSAAQEIIGLRKRIGDSAVSETFRQAIRKEPFLVHRSSP